MMRDVTLLYSEFLVRFFALYELFGSDALYRFISRFHHALVNTLLSEKQDGTLWLLSTTPFSLGEGRV
jgi:hypothetical protein